MCADRFKSYDAAVAALESCGDDDKNLPSRCAAVLHRDETHQLATARLRAASGRHAYFPDAAALRIELRMVREGRGAFVPFANVGRP
jgi:hypothetical protein